MNFFLFAISFLTSVVGSICGIGGGVILKPVLDAFSFANVATISFLSGCTVLSMSLYSVIKSTTAKDNSIDFKTAVPLAIGGAVGGLIGKNIFSMLLSAVSNQKTVLICQSILLAIFTLASLLYTCFQGKIRTHKLTSNFIILLVGITLGIVSSFLGIGGGPINLVVLYFFFSFDTKTAAQNSLFIILFSQLTSFATAMFNLQSLSFEWIWLFAMVLGGVIGGIVGRTINKKISEKNVKTLFIVLMTIIICISIFNLFR